MSIAIQAEHISKEYRLGVINHGMLYKDLQSWIARRMGRSDPHAKIGMERFSDNQDHFWALKDVSFEIKQGERVGLIGRNGAGKSTLLKLLSRITAPTYGQINIRGRVTSLLEVGTGFHQELSGRDNIFLNGAILGMKHREVAEVFDEIVAFSEIEKFIDTPVKRYSSGMYVRLAFAVAAHLDSEILLADEVLAVGDVAFQKKCLGKMEDISRSQGRTVVFVSHNILAVRSLCEKGMLLRDGRLVMQDDMDVVATNYLDKTFRNNAHFDDGIITDVNFSQCDEGLIFKIRYRDVTNVDIPCIGIKIADSMGYPLFSINPYNYKMIHDDSLGETGIVVVKITDPKLYSGEYRVSLVFADTKMSLESRDSCMSISIIDMAKTNKPVGRSHGPIHPLCSYSYS